MSVGPVTLEVGGTVEAYTDTMIMMETNMSTGNTTATSGGTNTISATIELTFLVLVSAIILSGNFLVLVTIIKRPDLQTPSNLYVFNLAITDMLVGMSIIMKVSETFFPEKFASAAICTVLRTGTVVHAMIMSVILMAGIAVDRFMAVYDPFRYQLLFTFTKTALIIACIWVYCFSIAYLPPILGYHRYHKGSLCHLSKVYQRNVVFNLVANFFLATFIIYFFYAALFRIAARHMKEIAAREAEGRGQAVANLQMQIKAAKTLLIVIGTFSLCWMPFVLNLLYIVMTTRDDPNSLSKRVQGFLSILLFFNCAVNPIIYARKIPGFRMEFIRILTCYKYERFGGNSVSPLADKSVSSKST